MRLPTPQYDRGILFVHGIGEQPRADTLLQCGDPLIRWLGRWLAQPGVGPVVCPGSLRVEAARVSPDESSEAPAHAVVGITAPRWQGESARHERWLLAEGRWAHEAQRPPFRRLAAWMLTTGAWIVLSHGLRWARGRPGWFHAATRVPQAIVASLVLTVTLQVAIVVLLALSVLPIPRLRALLSDVLLRTTGVLGDAYVLLESALQRRAIVDSVRRNLIWLAAQCREVAVIAHSQGAAVAHEALRDAEPNNVVLLVTYGSGLTKLEELKVMAERHSELIQFAKYGIPLSIVAAVASIRIMSYDDPWASIALLWCFLPILMLLAVADIAFRAPQALREHKDALSLRCRSDLDWLDLYATADAIPNGAMSIGGVTVDGVESRPVSNRGTQFTDHTSYWQNESEFIPAVLQRLDARFGCGLFDSAAERLAAAARAHAARVRWLTAARWSAVAAAQLWILVLWTRVEGIGRVAMNILHTPPLSPVGRFVAGLADGLGELAQRLAGVEAAGAARLGYIAAGAAIVAVGAAAAYRIFFIAWQAWERLHVARLFDPRSVSPTSLRLAGVAAMGLGFAPAALATGVCGALAVGYQPRPWTSSELLVYQVLGGAFVALLWIFAAAIAFELLSAWRARRAPIRPLLLLLGLIVLFALAYTPRLLPARATELVMEVLFIVGAVAVAIEHLRPRLGQLPWPSRVLIIALPLAPVAFAVSVLSTPIASSDRPTPWLPLASGLLATYLVMVWALTVLVRLIVRRARKPAPPVAGV